MTNGSGDLSEGKLRQVSIARFQKVLQGDPDAFWALIEPYSGLIYSVALGILKDPDLAQDILHEVYVKSFHSINNLRNPERLASWLHTLTKNLCYDFVRKQSIPDRKKADIYEHRTRVVPIYEVLIKEEELKNLEQGLALLPEPFRIILGMKYMNRMKCKEIAHILDISAEAVKSRLFEARRLLAHKMAESQSMKKSSQNGGC
jgi:RNA polymerase sigma-70 factor (ECF subfamily)